MRFEQFNLNLQSEKLHRLKFPDDSKPPATTQPCKSEAGSHGAKNRLLRRSEAKTDKRELV